MIMKQLFGLKSISDQANQLQASYFVTYRAFDYTDHIEK